MYSQTILLSVLVAIAEARFGQEQLPIAAIQAAPGGQSGQAATLAGQSISTLLGAANPCDKLTQADLIVATLGDGAIPAAQGLVAAEQNFNPSAVSIPSICDDPTLPTTAALRGIVPLVDPAVGGSGVENANSATSLKTPFDATGLSVAQVMAANGFSNVTAAGAAGAGAANGTVQSGAAASPATAAAAAATQATTLVTVTKAKASTAPAVSSAAASAASTTATAATAAGATNNGAAGVDPGQQKSSIAGLDFGTCTPTIKFEAGLDGRSATEFTFQAIDPQVNKGQEEALNPNIITNRICDQLGNVCGASAAGVSACTAAKAQIQGLGTKDQTTADAWNTALGFAGTNTNPDSAPQTGLVGHT